MEPIGKRKTKSNCTDTDYLHTTKQQAGRNLIGSCPLLIYKTIGVLGWLRCATCKVKSCGDRPDCSSACSDA